MYWACRWAFRSSFRWARATYSGFPPNWKFQCKIHILRLKFGLSTYPKFDHSFRSRPWWPPLVSWSKQSRNPLIVPPASWARPGPSPRRPRPLPSMAPRLVPRRLFQSDFLNFHKSNRKPLPISYHRHRWWLWHWWLSQKSWTPRAVTRLWLNRPNFWHKGSHLDTIKPIENSKTTLVSLDTLLLQLIILCLQFTLTLCLLLRPSAVNFLQ